MLTWFRELDRVLRGQATAVESLSEGDINVSGRRLVAADVLLAMSYGICLGVYGLANRDQPDIRFMLAALFKVPAMFLLTLGITFPSLYVFNALVGSAAVADHVGPADDGHARRHDGSARLAGADRRFLLGHHNQLFVHDSAERGRMCRGRSVRHALPVSDHAPAD